MKVVAWILLALVGLVILALLYYLLVGQILFKFIFARRSVVSRALKKDTEKRLKEFKIDLGWWERAKFSRVQTTSFDGLSLIGHFFEANSNRTVILFHGFGSSYREMQQYAKFFHDTNFNVLAVDMRAHGESEGACIGYGWLDRKDVLSWVEFVNEKSPQNKILLFGLSMGASAVCMAAGEKKLKNVVGIISDCAFANADKEIEFVMKKHKVGLKILKKHAYSFAKRVHGFDVTYADAANQVKNTTVPILFIHGQEDDLVPLENVNILFNSTPQALRDKLIVENANHAMAYSVFGVLYEKKVKQFIALRTRL